MKYLLYLIIVFTVSIPSFAFAQTYTVERVIDGDTIKLTNGERVQLIGIDTPESKPNDKAKRDSERTGKDIETITKMGQEATEYVKKLLPEGKEVHLEFDVQERDKYGRLLAYVFAFSCDGCVIEAIMGIKYIYIGTKMYYHVNATIILWGYASPMTIPPNVAYADLFQKLYEEAREQKRGLWKENVVTGRLKNTAEPDIGSGTGEVTIIKEHVSVEEMPFAVRKLLASSGASDIPLPEIENKAATLEICVEQGGIWGELGLSKKEICNLPATDKGKKCEDNYSCQGDCEIEITQEQKARILNGEEIEIWGVCSGWMLNKGFQPLD